MQCIKCKQEISENDSFCSHCGTNKYLSTAAKYAGLTNSGGILEFVRKIFKKVYAVLLWLSLIIITISSAITGWSIGYAMGYSNNIQILTGLIGIIFGLLVGALIGALVVIIVGGLIATFLKIDENVQKISDEIIALNNNQNKIEKE